MNDADPIAEAVRATWPTLTLAQQKAGEDAYLTATKYRSAVADYPAVVKAIGEAVLKQYRADMPPANLHT